MLLLKYDVYQVYVFGSAQLATTLSSLCRDKFQVYCRPCLGARAGAVCNA